MVFGLVWLAACGGATVAAPAASQQPSATSADSGFDSGYTTPATTVPGLPAHDDCLPVGRRMDDATCLAVIAHDDRFPGESFDKSGVPVSDEDPRIDDPEIAWLTSEIERCTCSCCHQSTLGGPGAFFWDLDYAGAVWLDSASAWSLNVLVGIHDSENQMLPTDDIERARRVVAQELERRRAP